MSSADSGGTAQAMRVLPLWEKRLCSSAKKVDAEGAVGTGIFPGRFPFLEHEQSRRGS